MLLIVIVSMQPVRPELVLALHTEMHWLAFGGLMFLLLLLSRTRRREIASFIATCLLGLSLECLQSFIYDNAIEWHDVRDDVFAALVALAAYRAIAVGRAALAAARRGYGRSIPAVENSFRPGPGRARRLDVP